LDSREKCALRQQYLTLSINYFDFRQISNSWFLVNELWTKGIINSLIMIDIFVVLNFS
jgi:hypothetical protein